jgi:hypothetical protein
MVYALLALALVAIVLIWAVLLRDRQTPVRPRRRVTFGPPVKEERPARPAAKADAVADVLADLPGGELSETPPNVGPAADDARSDSP